MIKSAPLDSRVSSPLAGLLGSASDVAIDVMEVCELQVRLARLDSKQAMQQSAFALSLIVVGVSITMASLPLLAFGLANCLSDQLSWEPWKAQLLVGSIATIVAFSLSALGLFRLRHVSRAFSRSSIEFAHNMNWLKKLVQGMKNNSTSHSEKGNH